MIWFLFILLIVLLLMAGAGRGISQYFLCHLIIYQYFVT